MVFKFDYIKKEYQPNENRFKVRFAWLPVYLKGDGVIVWLQLYQILLVYVVDVVITGLEDDKGKIREVGFKDAKWVRVDKRLIPKKKIIVINE